MPSTARVAPGEVFTVMGPSGSGKSTLLAFIGGFLDPAFSASGRVFIDGADLTGLAAQDRHAGILFQDPLLFPHMSVGANLAFAIPASVKGRSARAALADAALEDVGLAGMGERDPDTLSGGQKARVALARVAAVGPAHAAARRALFQARRRAARSRCANWCFPRRAKARLPVVLVTHDEADAEAAGGAILRIDDC